MDPMIILQKIREPQYKFIIIAASRSKPGNPAMAEFFRLCQVAYDGAFDVTTEEYVERSYNKIAENRKYIINRLRLYKMRYK